MTDNLNILICQGLGQHAIAQVRYKYSPLDEQAARRTIYPQEVFAPGEINRVGVRGAVLTQYQAVAIGRAVSSLRARYGADIPVQINLPDHMIDGPLSVPGIVEDAGRAEK